MTQCGTFLELLGLTAIAPVSWPQKMLISSTSSNLGTPRFRHVTASFPCIKPVSVGLVAAAAALHDRERSHREEDPVTTIDSAIDPQAMRIGIRFRQLRQAQEMTLVQLAVSADLSHPFLSQLELMAAAENDTADSVYFTGGIRHRSNAAEPGSYRLFVVKEKPESR